MFDLIAFDADDTLWHNERNYRTSREQFRRLMAKYELNGDLDPVVDRLEIDNIPYFGYGITGFVLSLVEAAVDLTSGQVAADDIQSLVDMAKEMATLPVELLDHVQATVSNLTQTHRLMIITKGDLLHQEMKVARSGLADYFSTVRVVSEKTPQVYAEILSELDVPPSRFLMVGNSLKSDIVPVLEIGGWAIYVPSEIIWSHEEIAPPAETDGRYFELAHLGLLPELVKQIGDKI